MPQGCGLSDEQARQLMRKESAAVFWPHFATLSGAHFAIIITSALKIGLARFFFFQGQLVQIGWREESGGQVEG